MQVPINLGRLWEAGARHTCLLYERKEGRRTAKCPYCGVKLLRDVVKKGRKRKTYRNYRCPRCEKI